MREQKAKDILLLHRLNEKPGKGMVAWLKSVIAVGSSGIAFLCIERLFLPRDRNARLTEKVSRVGNGRLVGVENKAAVLTTTQVAEWQSDGWRWLFVQCFRLQSQIAACMDERECEVRLV